MEIVNRMKAPTPKFFQKIKKIGIFLTGISALVIAAPIAMPALLVAIAGYAAVAGSTAIFVSSLTTDKDVIDKDKPIEEKPVTETVETLIPTKVDSLKALNSVEVQSTI
jgi:hypothetical protein